MKRNCCEVDNAVYPQDEMKSAKGVILRTNQPGHSCCDIKVKVSGNTSICKECSNTGKPVMEITLKNMVKEPALEAIENPEGFHFCETPTCEVIYFNNERQVYLHKQDVKARVGIKETENPVPVCYCFGWTQEKIFDQIM